MTTHIHADLRLEVGTTTATVTSDGDDLVVTTGDPRGLLREVRTLRSALRATAPVADPGPLSVLSEVAANVRAHLPTTGRVRLVGPQGTIASAPLSRPPASGVLQSIRSVQIDRPGDLIDTRSRLLLLAGLLLLAWVVVRTVRASPTEAG